MITLDEHGNLIENLIKIKARTISYLFCRLLHSLRSWPPSEVDNGTNLGLNRGPYPQNKLVPNVVSPRVLNRVIGVI